MGRGGKKEMVSGLDSWILDRAVRGSSAGQVYCAVLGCVLGKDNPLTQGAGLNRKFSGQSRSNS